MSDQLPVEGEKGRVVVVLRHIIDRLDESLQKAPVSERFSEVFSQIGDMKKAVDPLGPKVYDDAANRLNLLITQHVVDTSKYEFGELVVGLKHISSDKLFQEFMEGLSEELKKVRKTRDVMDVEDKLAVLRGALPAEE